MKLTRFSPLLLVLCAGCSWLPDHTNQYRAVETLPPMAVPEGMVFLGRDDQFTVPNPELRLHPEAGVKFRVAPPPSSVRVAEVAPSPENAPATEAAPDSQKTRMVLSRDGNDFPIIMIYARFEWAWEYVGNGLAKTDIKVEDRSRDDGIFFVILPKDLAPKGDEYQIKLSHTVNGVQVALLNQKGSALADKALGDAVLKLLHDKL